MGLTQVFSDIADAIREKNGSSDTYLPTEMAQAILDIPSGGTVILEPIIPRMTSDTTPSGECSASYLYQSRKAYYGFTTNGMGDVGISSQFWYNGGGTDQYIQYKFDESQTLYYIGFGVDSENYNKRFKFQFSTDGITFADGETMTTKNTAAWNWYKLTTPQNCLAFRIYVIDNIDVISGIDARGTITE